jgi:hypothetical protein
MVLFYVTVLDVTVPTEIRSACSVYSLYSRCMPGNNNIILFIKCIQFRLYNNACRMKLWLHAPINSQTAHSASNITLLELRTDDAKGG